MTKLRLRLTSFTQFLLGKIYQPLHKQLLLVNDTAGVVVIEKNGHASILYGVPSDNTTGLAVMVLLSFLLGPQGAPALEDVIERFKAAAQNLPSNTSQD